MTRGPLAPISHNYTNTIHKHSILEASPSSAPGSSFDGGKWKCEDECLTSVETKGANSAGAKEENLLCGGTNHLTNFAILLMGNDAQKQCQSGKDGIFGWIFTGMVGGAVVVILLSVLVIELFFH